MVAAPIVTGVLASLAPLSVGSFLKHPCSGAHNRFIRQRAARLAALQAPASQTHGGCCSRFAAGAAMRGQVSNGCRCHAFFRFGGKKDSNASTPAGSREDYAAEDVEYYFNYMGMLADEGSYASLDSLLQTGMAPVDLLLLMACAENDTPKVAELMAAGADASVKRADGKGPADLATSEAVLDLLKAPTAA